MRIYALVAGTITAATIAAGCSRPHVHISAASEVIIQEGTDHPIRLNPTDRTKIVAMVNQIGELSNKISPHSKGCVWGFIDIQTEDRMVRAQVFSDPLWLEIDDAYYSIGMRDFETIRDTAQSGRPKDSSKR